MRRYLFLILAIFMAPQAFAARDVIVDKVWMRESVPGQTAATVQLNLYVTKDAKLLGVSSPLAESGGILSAQRRSGKMMKKNLARLKLAAHSNTLFGEHGLYLILKGLKQPLNTGDQVPVTLKVEVGGKVKTMELLAEVRALELSYMHYNDPAVMDHP